MIARQRGMAVLTVLLLIALMTLLAIGAQDRFQQAVRTAQSGRFMLQSGWSLLGAESWLIQRPPLTPQGPQQLQLEQDLIHYQWRDGQACFNLNALGRTPDAADTPGGAIPAQNGSHPDAALRPDSAGQPPRSPPSVSSPPGALASAGRALTAAQRLFIRLLSELDVPAERARSLTLALGAQLRSGAFIEPSELRAQATGFDPDLWPRLAPLVCALPAERLQININGLTAAQLPLLSALFDGTLSPSQARELLNARPATGWPTLTAMLAATRQQNASEGYALLLSVAVTKSSARELLMWTGDGQHSNSLRSRLTLRDGHLQVTHRLYGLSE